MPITPFAEYQQHADECRLLAFLTTKAEQKTMLEDMAWVWEKAAKEYERDLQPEQETYDAKDGAGGATPGSSA